jgi:acyl-coenzyme A thioesterase PaaI-like protein
MDISPEMMDRTGLSCFVRGESRGEDGQLVAMGQGTFRILQGNGLL